MNQDQESLEAPYISWGDRFLRDRFLEYKAKLYKSLGFVSVGVLGVGSGIALELNNQYENGTVALLAGLALGAVGFVNAREDYDNFIVAGSMEIAHNFKARELEQESQSTH